MRSLFAETLHSTQVKVIDPPDAFTARRYLKSQTNLIPKRDSTKLFSDLTELERVLNFEVACDVAVGTLNVLTVGDVSSEEHVPRSGVGSSSSSSAGPSGPSTWDAFWDPATVGYQLPLRDEEGCRLYSGADTSLVGIAGTGTVLDRTVRSSNEMLLSDYIKQTFQALKEQGGGDVKQALRSYMAASMCRALGGGDVASPSDVFPIPPALLYFQFPQEVENIRMRLSPLSPSIKVVPYKVVFYGEGDYFLPHVDSMDHNALQFGSLAVQLPIEYPVDASHYAGGPTGSKTWDEPSCVSGELVFYVGRELDAEEKPFEATDAGSDSHFHNRTWTAYGRPTTDEEQLRIRVDLTTHLPATEVPPSDVKQWLSSHHPSLSIPTTTQATPRFKIQPLKYAAWQGDIPHEVAKVTTGYRAVILYRLVKSFAMSVQPRPKTFCSDFLAADSVEVLSRFACEQGIKPFPVYPTTSDLMFHADDYHNGEMSLWDRFMAQTEPLRTYYSSSYHSVINPRVRDLIHRSVASVLQHLPSTPPPGLTPSMGGTRMLEEVVSHLASLPSTDTFPMPLDPFPGSSGVSHLAFVLRHQYPTAVLRILCDLQSADCALPMGRRSQMIMSLLKGGDAILYGLLVEVAEVSIHAVHQVKKDFASTPYRLRSKATNYGQWIQQTYPAHLEPASSILAPDDAGMRKVELETNLGRDDAEDTVGYRYPTFIDCAWVSMGMGKVIGGGQSFGNCDCGSEWWYRSSVMIVNPSRLSSLYWRSRVLLWALMKKEPNGERTAPHPLVWSLRTLVQHPDLFLHVCSFL